METTPVIKVLENADYRNYHIVPLSNAGPLSPLAPSSLRLRTTLIALTANTLSYARMGHLFGWDNVHPLPLSILPEELRNPKKYNRISGWGYAEVIESTLEAVPVGRLIFGWCAIGTLPWDLEVKVAPDAKGQLRVTSPHRQDLFPVWNCYNIGPLKSELSDSTVRTGLGWDALMLVLFETSYLTNLHGFAWEDVKRVHPTGGDDPWGKEDADLTGSIIFIFAASGKTALSFAHQLRRNRPQEYQPKSIIAVTSQASKSFLEGVGYYDKVVLYSDIDAAKAELDTITKVSLWDFGARSADMTAWYSALKEALPNSNLRVFGVGGEARPMTMVDIQTARAEWAKMGRISAHASSLRDWAMAKGEQAYFDTFENIWGRFKDEGGIPGLKMKWGKGMEALGNGWEKLSKGELEPGVGLLFEL